MQIIERWQVIERWPTVHLANLPSNPVVQPCRCTAGRIFPVDGHGRAKKGRCGLRAPKPFGRFMGELGVLPGRQWAQTEPDRQTLEASLQPAH
jgi:hypothetical protein